MASKKKIAGPVTLVGTGPGDTSLLTVAAVEALAAAQLVVGDAELLDGVAAHLDETVERLPGGSIAEAVTAAKAGQRVVVLLDGDVFTSAAGVAAAQALTRAKAAYDVVPGVPPALAVAAFAGVPLGAAAALTVLDLGTDTDDDTLQAALDGADWAGLAGAPGTLVVRLPVVAVGKAAATLVEHGRPGDQAATVTVGGASTAQLTVAGQLDGVGEQVDAQRLGGVAVLVAGSAARSRDRLPWWESRPLFGWSVLVPRTRAQAGETAALLRSYGAAPLEVPTIAVEPPRTPAPMERAIKGLVSGRYAWVAFTSANAVKAVREKLIEYGLDARAFAGVKIAAVGTQTAEALVEFGIRADLVPAGQQSAEGLLEEFPDYDDVFDMLDRVLLPRADIATESLVAGLQEHGWEVDDITAYRTVRAAPPAAAVREAIKGGKVDAALFTSSSTVRNLVGIAGKPHERTVIACIGPATEATARDLGLRVDVVPAEATVPALAAALAEFVVARRAEEAAAAPTPITDARKPARVRKR